MLDGSNAVAGGFNFQSLVNPKTGEVDRRIFSDEQIYQLELERIFARAWNFMCHESQIPKPGDFFLTFIGDDSVIATRDKTGKLQVLLNTCRHRGNAVCRAEQGHATSFLCTYHGWTFGLDGKLIGVPGYKDFYHEDLDRSQWGLIPAGKVASYKGFVFATMDAEAPDLDEYLGEVGRMGLDLMAARGEIVVVDGIQKNLIGCNWKLAVDNLFDWYHVAISHASALQSGSANLRRSDAQSTPVFNDKTHRVVLGDYGHAIGGPRLTPEMQQQLNENPEAPQFQQMELAWRTRPEALAQLGALGVSTIGHPNIFPNLWVASGGTQLSLRLPRGPNQTEIWWFTILDKSLVEERRKNRVDRANHVFGPAGMLEQDDGENWDQSSRATRGTMSKRYPLNFAMNLGHGKVVQDNTGPAHVEAAINEHAQLWTYRAWADWMSADSWADLKRTKTQVPTETV